MASKSDISSEQVRIVVDRIAAEVGLIVSSTSGFTKIQSPGNKHRMYIQKCAGFGRIDSTLPQHDGTGATFPGTRPLNAPNGSITHHVESTFEHLEFHMRRLADSTISTQVPNKPKPFAATKQPARKLHAVAAPVPELEAEPVVVPEGGTLKDRLASIAARSRLARVNRLMENDQTGSLTLEEAEAVVDGKTTMSIVTEAKSNASSAELGELVAESGIEVA